jgi:hypothetical protein
VDGGGLSLLPVDAGLLQLALDLVGDLLVEGQDDRGADHLLDGPQDRRGLAGAGHGDQDKGAGPVPGFLLECRLLRRWNKDGGHGRGA